VNILDIISSARADLVDAGFASDIHKQIINNIKETGNIYGDVEVISQEQDGKTPLFVGCQYLSRPNKTKKYIKILEQLGINPLIQKEICCGFPMEILGFKKEFETHKKKFQKSFPYDEAITFCPTCALFLKEGYGINTKHVLQVIHEKIPRANLGLKVTYHDPCDLSRGLKIIDEPRKILEKLGVEIIEMKNNKGQSNCCGGGGGILMSDQALSKNIAKNRIKQAIETGADILVTSCPTCEKVLKKAATESREYEGDGIVVRNIEDIIWMWMKNSI
jgi:glycolate oxidase